MFVTCAWEKVLADHPVPWYRISLSLRGYLKVLCNEYPAGPRQAFRYSIWWRLGPHLVPKMSANCSMMHLGEPFYLVHRAQENHAPDSRWTLELNSSVIELKLKLSPCCSGPHLFRVLAAARPVSLGVQRVCFAGE